MTETNAQCRLGKLPFSIVKCDIMIQKKMEYVIIVKILCAVLPFVVAKTITYCPKRERTNPTKNLSAKLVNTNSVKKSPPV